ncbi:membrane protein [Streptomyces prasinosporus]|uniref:Membrane protein n=1 Tax=Streptomyces prasinosporus TaxID=68256 RepID=A0ABP6TFT6_9ACTN
MEHPRTRPAQYGPRRDTPPRPSKPPRPSGSPGPSGSPLPPQAGRAAGGGVARSARPAGAPQRRPVPARRPAPSPAARRLPHPRLTGLGGGLFCGLVMLALGLLVSAVFGASQTVYGVLFLPVCVLTAVWLREGDLLTAPVIVPIAFAVGLVPVAGDGADGTGDRLMGLVTGLATQVGWLYGGTLTAGLIVLGRRIRVVNRRTVKGRPRV